MATINPQYAKYMAMAERYRKNNRPELAAALERQAQRELEKPAMDITDVANIQNVPQNDNGGYINANGWNTPQQAPQQAQQVVQQPVQQVAPVQQPVQQQVWQPTNPNVNPNVNKVTPPAKPAPYKPTAEELANMADSEQYSNVAPAYNPNYNTLYDGGNLGEEAKVYDESNGGDNAGGTTVPSYENRLPHFFGSMQSNDLESIPQSERQTVGSGIGKGGSFSPEWISSIPGTEDMYLNATAEQDYKTTEDKKKKQEEIANLAKKSKFAKLYPEYYEINKKDFS